MTPEVYRERALARSPKLEDFTEQLLLCGLGSAEEAGEVAGIVKKHVFHGRPFSRDHFIDEIGDVLWYLDRALALVDCTMEMALTLNDLKLEQRYPSGFKRES
jgi:NTP pyrophosphatase (non-canonical NTP hydrolase)